MRKLAAFLILAVVTMAPSALAFADDGKSAGEPAGPPAEEQFHLVDVFGKLVSVPASSLPKGLLPPSDIGLGKQVPGPASGAHQPAEVEQRLDAARKAGFELFPAAEPKLGSYLAGQDEQGNTAVRPGPLFEVAPLESVVQQGKYRLSEGGFRYSLSQAIVYGAMGGATTGATSLGFYTLDFVAKWAVYGDRSAGSAGWISAAGGPKTGLGSAGFRPGAPGRASKPSPIPPGSGTSATASRSRSWPGSSR